jgi:hypothetical protein
MTHRAASVNENHPRLTHMRIAGWLFVRRRRRHIRRTWTHDWIWERDLDQATFTNLLRRPADRD